MNENKNCQQSLLIAFHKCNVKLKKQNKIEIVIYQNTINQLADEDIEDTELKTSPLQDSVKQNITCMRLEN